MQTETMASSNGNNQDSVEVGRSEQLVDRFLDAIWMERGLSQNTLGAYRADLMTLGRGLSERNKSIDTANKADLLAFLAKRVEDGAKPRSTARQLSSFRRFFRYIMREGLRDTDPTARYRNAAYRSVAAEVADRGRSRRAPARSEYG